MLNDQISADKIYFKYQSGYGNVGIGTTGFVDGETVWFGPGAEQVLVLVQFKLVLLHHLQLDKKEQFSKLTKHLVHF